jgi:endonuclease/exonuclease/phosphatase (EEP) superfamily protein YafD
VQLDLRAGEEVDVVLRHEVDDAVTGVTFQFNLEPPADSDDVELDRAAALAADADVAVAIETSPEFRDLLAMADGVHPYASVDAHLVVRSSFPVAAMPDPAGVPARRVLRVRVDAPATPFVLYAVHALNPLSESTFAGQLAWVDRLRASAAAETMPVVMAGDFNMTDRQLGYRRMTGDLRDAVISAGWGHTTYPHGIWVPLLLRIDHVFLTPTWCSARSRTFDVPGSDHDAVQVDVGPCP